MEKLFELTFQDQTLTPQVGTFTDASQTTGTFTLEDGEYYLTNGDTKGFYTYAPIAIQPDSETDNKVTIEFDLKVVTASVNRHGLRQYPYHYRDLHRSRRQRHTNRC